jgi:hypothetical protein
MAVNPLSIPEVRLLPTDLRVELTQPISLYMVRHTYRQGQASTADRREYKNKAYFEYLNK